MRKGSARGSFSIPSVSAASRRTQRLGSSISLKSVSLKPDSEDASYKPIVLEGLAEGELRIVAELVAILPISKAVDLNR